MQQQKHPDAAAAASIRLFIGTWSEAGYELRYTPATNTFENLGTVQYGPNPSIIAFDKTKRHIIAVNELDKFLGKNNTGGLTVFDLVTREKTSVIASLGNHPCYIELFNLQNQNYVTVANYNANEKDAPMASTFAIFEYDELKGQLNSTPAFLGSNVDKSQQITVSHPHMFTLWYRLQIVIRSMVTW